MWTNEYDHQAIMYGSMICATCFPHHWYLVRGTQRLNSEVVSEMRLLNAHMANTFTLAFHVSWYSLRRYSTKTTSTDRVMNEYHVYDNKFQEMDVIYCSGCRCYHSLFNVWSGGLQERHSKSIFFVTNQRYGAFIRHILVSHWGRDKLTNWPPV